ncbi:fungal chitin synthase, partial [Basidiobolus meristosporus CBS 931.73]
PEYPLVNFDPLHCILLVTCYSEGKEGLRTTLESLATTHYPISHKLILVIADGQITGAGNEMSTPDICLSMLGDEIVPFSQVQPYAYVAIADGRKRHNTAKIYAGHYQYEQSASAGISKVPMIVIVKCGAPEEVGSSKPGNRGKRDSQIMLMSFFQKVMFDERMSPFEFELFNMMWKVSGVSPDRYELLMMVDADTKVHKDSLTHMAACMAREDLVMGCCGETKIANKNDSWVTMMQVFEYHISHHLSKSFESVFGGVTCLPGCFSMYRIKTRKGPNDYWVPILANPDVIEHYSENIVDTLHKKNLLLLGEDRYLTTLLLKTFPKRKLLFVPQAICKTVVPDTFAVLLSQRRRWINSTVHNMLELVLVRDLCGIFCFSMQFFVFMELLGTVVLPAAILFTLYLLGISFLGKSVPVIPLVLLSLVLGLPALLILSTTRRFVYLWYMIVYLLTLPIWNLVLPTYAYWHFDDFTWGQTRLVEGESETGLDHSHKEGEFDHTSVPMHRWLDWERIAQGQRDPAGISRPS